MKLNEIIELNGKEYEVELNRESLLKIDQYTNMQKASEEIQQSTVKDKSELNIEDDENPFAEEINEEELEKQTEKKEKIIKKIITRAFWIWLYPKERLSISQVEKILQPYFESEEKAIEISNIYEDLTQKSVDIREKYLEERKNLKALAK